MVSSIVLVALLAFAVCADLIHASNGKPPCYTPLNPALETICFTTIATYGNFSLRSYGGGLNVSLITSASANFGGWQETSTIATEQLFLYFEGENSAYAKVPTTVPLFYRPQGATSLLASMAIPTSAFPNPNYAPRPFAAYDKQETFPAGITVATLRFDTAALATDLDYSFACGELTEWLTEKGITPVAGAWGQVWVTYSGRNASPHVNECWVQVKLG